MAAGTHIKFDRYVNRVKSNNRKQFFELISSNLSECAQCDPNQLIDLLDLHICKSDSNAVQSVRVFDIKSSVFHTPATLIATLDEPLDLDAVDQKPVDIVAVVLSTQDCGAAHLQRLAKVSRLLIDQNFCQVLRDSDSEDTMRALCMPEQEWMKAA